MGYRVHVVKHTEKFADIEAFNWKNQEFANLLDDLGCNVCGEEPYERFECLKEYFKTAIDLIKCYKEKGTVDLPQEELEKFGISKETYEGRIDGGEIDLPWVDEQLADTEDELGYTTDELLNTMEAFLEAADPDSDYIIFVAW